MTVRSGRAQEEQVLVSVIMPAYNCAKTIGTAIDSVLLQNVPLELIVLNDCSREELDSVMEVYLDDPRVRYLKNEKNLGAAATRNRGVQLARGTYVAFLDSDDWWEAGKLEAQMKVIEEKHVVLCSTARELVTPEGALTGRIISVNEEITYRRLLWHNCINCSSVVLLREAALKYPMQHEDSHEDYIAWIRLLREYREAAAINYPYLKYRLSNTWKSGSKWKSAKMTYTVYRYCGFSTPAAVALFCRYAVNGILKYAMAYIKKH